MGPLLVFFGKKLSDAMDIFTLRYEDNAMDNNDAFLDWMAL
jgi:hypothetical protein